MSCRYREVVLLRSAGASQVSDLSESQLVTGEAVHLVPGVLARRDLLLHGATKRTTNNLQQLNNVTNQIYVQ